MKPVFIILLINLFFTASLFAQSTDSTNAIPDTAIVDTPVIDSLKPTTVSRKSFQLKNKILNSSGEPVSFAVKTRKQEQDDLMFYFILGIALLLAFLKFFYNRYFSNLFRVFFNTSLRQSQLTDQLLQAKLPSLLFNLFFFISSGLFVYILLSHYQLIGPDNKWVLIFSSIALLSFIYLVKYATLKFTGWITGLKDITNIYVFIIFLINKIIGIFLIPIIIILTYSGPEIAKIVVLISLLSILIFLLLRYIRSYSLLQNRLKISRFHFLLYVTGIELLPLLLVYKALMVYLTKML